jgi:hypothetical protein
MAATAADAPPLRGTPEERATATDELWRLLQSEIEASDGGEEHLPRLHALIAGGLADVNVQRGRYTPLLLVRRG